MNQLELPMPVTGLPLEVRALSEEIHQDNIKAGWWKQGYGDDGQGDILLTIPRNIGELIALIHSEISEADHGFELGLMDDKLPYRPMVEVELADTAIRALDVLGFHKNHCIASRSLPLPVDAHWPDWCRQMHRETTCALEGFRKGDPDRGCAHLVDLLGIIHFAAIRFRYDLTGAIAEKRAFNAQRADHKPENRALTGGKSF